jgi:hypothetical protein
VNYQWVPQVIKLVMLCPQPTSILIVYVLLRLMNEAMAEMLISLVLINQIEAISTRGTEGNIL